MFILEMSANLVLSVALLNFGLRSGELWADVTTGPESQHVPGLDRPSVTLSP